MTDTLVVRLITFAKSDDTIVALTKVSDPEDDILTRSVVYYFIVNSHYDEKRSDKLSELDIALAQEGYNHSLAEWPDVTISDYPFLGEVLWKRNS